MNEKNNKFVMLLSKMLFAATKFGCFKHKTKNMVQIFGSSVILTVLNKADEKIKTIFSKDKNWTK